jgi:hypothetical protein
MRRIAIPALAVAAALGGSCSTYDQTMDATKTIWSVRVVYKPEEVKQCRFLANVDSTASPPGCGLTVQPTTDECLRFQVRYVGGDTLLFNGLVGKAYDCGLFTPTPTDTPAPAPAVPTPTPAAAPPPAAAPAPSPVPAAPAPTPAPVPTVSPAGVRIVHGRELVRGCVYLDDLDPAECGGEGAPNRENCLSERAGRIGGNTVLLEGGRARIFECRATP